MRNIFKILFLSLFAAACNPSDKSVDQQIENAIAYHGGESYDSIDTKFNFRDKLYILHHAKGSYRYERVFQDSAERKVNDVLENQGFRRLVNGDKVELSAKDSAAYANSVNSVHYFALLPYNLKDEAVRAHAREDMLIGGKAYKTIEVNFHQDGGGTDYEDVFMFWFDAKTYALDYFAYSYNTDGGGVRFRESINKERIEGVIFQDYNNFKAEKGTDLIDLPILFSQDELELLSVIDLEFDVENP